MKFFLQDDTAAEVDKILAQLKSYMDGEIAQQMKNSGLNYQLNYGVSMFWIRKISKQYEQNQKLADRLWHREARETMIMACIISNSSSFDTEKIEQWFSMIKTNELAEQFGVHLLSRIDTSTNLSQQYITSSNKFKQAAAWAALATIIKSDTSFNKEFYILKAFNTITTDATFLQRIKGRFLRAACRNSKQLLAMVENQLKTIEENKNTSFLTQELKTEIEFLKEQ